VKVHLLLKISKVLVLSVYFQFIAYCICDSRVASHLEFTGTVRKMDKGMADVRKIKSEI